MNESDVAVHLTRWLSDEAATYRPPAELRERIATIPQVPAREFHWLRFAPLAALSAAAAALLIAVVSVAGPTDLFDRPPGFDGGPCNNRQLQRALAALRDASGYRYVAYEDIRDFDPSREISMSDPAYVWLSATTTEGSYRAPDRARERVSAQMSPLLDPGYHEQLLIGGDAWRQVERNGGRLWLHSANPLPTANIAHGYVVTSSPSWTVPIPPHMVVPDYLPPGEGGCVAGAMRDGGTDEAVAIRIDTASGRPIAIYRGPPADATPRHGATRIVIEIAWTEPAESEFEPPAEFVEDEEAPPIPDDGGPSMPPVPTPDPAAWPARPLPLPADEEVAASVSSAVAGEGVYVVVGGYFTLPDFERSGALVWTSTNGLDWSLAERPPGFESLAFQTVQWSGSEFLAIGYREHVDPEAGPTGTVQAESWLSADGLTWRPGGQFEPGAEPSGPVAAGPGWVAGGAVWQEQQMRPAVFTSPDGDEWATHFLPGTSSGRIGRMLVTDDGSLVAYSCESPGETNSAMTGELCFNRAWRSPDGVEWTAGPIVSEEVWNVIALTDGYLLIGSERDSGVAIVWRSEDLSSLAPLPLPEGSEVAIESAATVGEALVLEGNRGVGRLGYPVGAAWRSPDGGRTWSELPLSFPLGGGSYVEAIIGLDGRVAFFGTLQPDESRSAPVIWIEP